MPELPEVETIRRDLDKEITERRIKTVEVKAHRSVRRHRTTQDFINRLEGRKVKAVDRKGKYLLSRLDDGNVLVVHVGMSGQLLRTQNRDPVERHTHVTITFTQGGQLRFVDPRTFGELFVTAPDDLASEVPELAHLGFDPLEQAMSWTDFGGILQTKKTKLKPLLMDQ